MNKFLRIISTLVVGIGILLLFAYLGFQNSQDKSQILNQPSYYTLQNYWYLLVAGCGCVAFSIISCFLAWNKKLDEKIEILPNAVAADRSELLSWLTGSSLDTRKKARKKEHWEPEKKRSKKTAAFGKIDETATQKSVHIGVEKDAVTQTESTVVSNADNTVIGNTDGTVISNADSTVISNADSTVISSEETLYKIYDKDNTDECTIIEGIPTMNEPDADRTILSVDPETSADNTITVIESV